MATVSLSSSGPDIVCSALVLKFGWSLANILERLHLEEAHSPVRNLYTIESSNISLIGVTTIRLTHSSKEQ